MLTAAYEPLFTPLALPNGAVLPNRIAKAAMEENLADPGQLPGPALWTLYRRWAQGGVGLQITGNVMIDPSAVTGPGGVVLDARAPLAPFETWAKEAKSGGGQVWMQINHPGRQTYADLGQGAVAPSAVPVDLGKLSNLLAQPRALTADEIIALVERYAITARRAEEAGFDGVQIHAAHGYLISQFLSPLVNRRDDAWGGSRENRARMLFEVIKAVRARVSPRFVVSVKLNSADFQKGGFDADDARWVVEQMNGMGVDLVELSGGSYESPAMQGPSQVDTAPKTSTAAREAYFVDFARDIAKVAKMPIMVTGGVCRRDVALAALSPEGALPGVPVIGIARALAFAPDLPNAWRKPDGLDVTLPEVSWKNRSLAGLAVMALTKAQLNRLAAGKAPARKLSPLLTVIGQRIKQNAQTKRYRAWRLSNP